MGFCPLVSEMYSLGSERWLCFPHRQKPYVIRSPRRRLAVEVQLQNRLENAYNTSLMLHYSRNLHFSSLSIRVNSTNIPSNMFNSSPDFNTTTPFLFIARRRMPTSSLSARRSTPTATRATSVIQCSAPSQKYVLEEFLTNLTSLW